MQKTIFIFKKAAAVDLLYESGSSYNLKEQNAKMKTLLCWVFSLLLFSYIGYSQTPNRVYANSVSNFKAGNLPVPAAAYVSNPNNATGPHDDNFAVLRARPSVLGPDTYSSFIELQFPTPVAANTPVYIRITTPDQTNLLGALLGGSLANVISDLLQGTQQFTLESRNNAANGASYTSFTGERLRVVRHKDGHNYIRFTPETDFTHIRITNSVTSGLFAGERRLHVYDAHHMSGNIAADCAEAEHTSFSGGGINATLLGSGHGVVNPHHVIDEDHTTHSSLHLGNLGVGAFAEQTIYFASKSQSSDRFSVRLKINQSLIAINALDNITITTHHGGQQVTTHVLSSLLSADLLGLLQSGDIVSVPVEPNAVIDRVTVRYSAVANASVTQRLDLYGVYKTNFDVDIPGQSIITVCQNTPLNLTAESTPGCYEPHTYSWSGGLGSTNAVTIPTTTSGTTNYTVTVTNAIGTRATETVTVVVVPAPIAGTISPPQTVCSGSAINDIELSGYTGNIVRWESSAEPTFTNPVTINNTSSVLTGAAIGPLSQTTYFRAVVGNNNCTSVFSPGVAVNINATTWNGLGWSNGLPNALTTTINISGNYTADNTIVGCTLNITNNAVVTIPAGLNVILDGAITVEDGSSFTLENNANLIQFTNAVNTGTIYVNKNTNPLQYLDYTLWSSPTNGTQTVKMFSPSTLNDRFYVYNTALSAYSNLNSASQQGPGGFNPTTSTFTPAKGYLIRMPNNVPQTGTSIFNGQFWGVPNNGTITIPLNTQGEGYNAVGNPYPSPINVVNFITSNQTNLENGTLYFWRKTNNPTAPSYATLTQFAYTANVAAGGDTSNGAFSGAPSGWVINSGQGFLVKASPSAGALTFNNGMRQAVNNGQFFRGEQQTTAISDVSRFWLNMAGNGGEFTQAVIGYSSTTTMGLDYGMDGVMMNDGHIALYSEIENIPLAIQARASFFVEDIVPLTYKATSPGTYTFSIQHADGVFAAGQKIYLKDKSTNQEHDLSAGDYSFTTIAGTFAGRFEIKYTNTTLNVNDNIINNNDVIAYKNESGLNIESVNKEISQVMIYDIAGRMIYNRNDVNTAKTIIQDLVPDQILLVRITTTDGVKTDKKVIY